MFTNFHQHSHYSFLDGCSTCEDIVVRCKELGMEHACVCDHGNCAAHIEFLDACEKHGIKPVLGTELYFNDEKHPADKRYHLTLWAKNDEGLHNLWAISSNTYYSTGEGHRKPIASWEDMEGLGSGVICTSACLSGPLAKSAEREDEEAADYFSERLSSIFEDFYIELHTNGMDEQRKVNLWLSDYADKRGLKTIYAVDAHYAREEDAAFHDVWLGCQIKAFYDENHWKMDHEYYVQGEEEVRKRLSYLGEDAVQKAISGGEDFLSQIEQVHVDVSLKIPKYPLVPEKYADSGEYLKHLCMKGIFEKVFGVEFDDSGDKNVVRCDPSKIDAEKLKAYVSMVEEEFPIILENGLADYFLITAEYSTWAKERMLVGPARGSAAASMVCYLLGITTIDPMGKGLIFSRFLNNGRMARYEIEFDDGSTMQAYATDVFVLSDGSKKKFSELRDGDEIVEKLD